MSINQMFRDHKAEAKNPPKNKHASPKTKRGVKLFKFVGLPLLAYLVINLIRDLTRDLLYLESLVNWAKTGETLLYSVILSPITYLAILFGGIMVKAFIQFITELKISK